MSTDISIDPRVRDLAQRSEFAALLYTWMIPHATDAGLISADPDALLMLVVPGFRWRTRDDVAEAVSAMVELGLVSRTADGHQLRFPPEAFYRYQSYIPPGRRGDETEPPPEPDHGAINGNHRDAASPPQNAAKRRNAPESPQKSAPVSVSGSLSGTGDLEQNKFAPQTRARAHEREPVSIEARRRVPGEPVPKPVPKPTPVGTFLDAVRALDPDLDVCTERGFLGARLKENPETNLALLAEAYVSYRHGEWPGTKKLQETGNPVWIIGDVLGYVSWRDRRHNGSGSNGQKAEVPWIAHYQGEDDELAAAAPTQSEAEPAVAF